VSRPRQDCHLTPDGDWAPGAGPRGAVRIWPYTQHWKYPVRVSEPGLLDPVNAFVVGAPPARVIADLARVGWARPADGGIHRLWIRGWPRRMFDHVAIGTRERRVHARLWPVGGGAVVATHDERLDISKGKSAQPFPPSAGVPADIGSGRHVVLSWDSARERLASALQELGYLALSPSAVVAEPGLRGVPGDGRIWRFSSP